MNRAFLPWPFEDSIEFAHLQVPVVEAAKEKAKKVFFFLSEYDPTYALDITQ